MNDIRRGPLANVLVFHDPQSPLIDLKGFLYYLEDWFEKIGLMPNRISGRGKKNIGFIPERKRLENENFSGLKNGFWLAAIPSNAGTEMFDFTAAVHLYYHVNNRRTFLLCWDNQLCDFTRPYLNSLSIELYSYLKADYGYAYQSKFDYGPSFYPLGVVGSELLSLEEELSIAKWAAFYGRNDGNYRSGLLRDIYPMNLLSEPHLSQQVFDTHLQSWIESSPDHGELKKLTDTLWEWWVPEDKIEFVRESLKPTGVLLCA